MAVVPYTPKVADGLRHVRACFLHQVAGCRVAGFLAVAHADVIAVVPVAVGNPGDGPDNLSGHGVGLAGDGDKLLKEGVDTVLCCCHGVLSFLACHHQRREAISGGRPGGRFGCYQLCRNVSKCPGSPAKSWTNLLYWQASK